jgi:t-SNARE complex subunit (syntaxin)
MEESQKQAMIDAYKERLLSQANGMEESVLMQMCLTAFRHGIENTLAEVEPKQQKLKKLADAMYHAAQYLTTDASHLRKAMEEYHLFVIRNKI